MSKLFASLRLLRAGYVLAREGVLSAFPADGLTGLPAFGYRIVKWISRDNVKHRKRAERISNAMNRLGPSYVKLGQFLATRPDIVGRQVADDLSLLQDKMKTFPHAAAIMQIESSLGRNIDDLYVDFSEPIAAASMAQVHPAWTVDENGKRCKVAVKVIRPNIRHRFIKDLQGFYLIAEMQERYVPSLRRLHPIQVVQNLEQTTRLEMDLRLEAAALSEIGENTAKDTGFRVPNVDWERTGRDVLTMEWIDGIKMSDIDGLKAAGFDLKALSVTLIQSFLRHTLRDGFFHADMHPGNLFVDKDSTIVAVDLGITGRLGKKEKRYLAEILYGFIKRDYYRVAKVHFEAGYVPSHHSVESFAQANRAIGEPVHGQSAETISMARLLTLLFEVTELFDMETRPELILLQKTMVVVEGVARTLDPNLNMWKAADPVVSQWIMQNLGPAGIAKDFCESAIAISDFVRKTPDLTKRFDEITYNIAHMSKHGIVLDEATLKQLARYQSRSNRFMRYAFYIIAACILYLTIRFVS